MFPSENRRQKFRQTDPKALGGVELARQPKVDDLDLVSVRRDAEDVLRFEVEVQNPARVHVGDTIADLAHEVDALTFRQHVVLADDPLQQLPASDAIGVRNIK